MREIPADIYLHICTKYLDYSSILSLSASSKFFHDILSTQSFWKRLFDLYFSVECVESTINWKSEFVKEHAAHKNSRPLWIGAPAVILNQELFGKVVEIIEDIPSFHKFKIHLYQVHIAENETRCAIPTNNLKIFPSK